MKNLNKKQKIAASLLIVISAVLLILTIIFGVEFGQYKKQVNAEPSNDVVALSIDVDGDFKPDYQFNITGKYKGESLKKFLEDDSLGDQLKATFESKYGMLVGLNWTYNTFDGGIKSTKTGSINTGDMSKEFLEITSDTSEFVSGPENMTTKGAADLILGKSNSFMFSLQSVTAM